jgi:predicted DNA-binding transcriptional regulator AlpA
MLSKSIAIISAITYHVNTDNIISKNDSRYMEGRLQIKTTQLPPKKRQEKNLDKRIGGTAMNQKTSYDQLPIMLNANTIAQTLGISRAGAYELMHSEGFPTLRIGKRMMVSKEHFIQWIERSSGEAV